MLKLKYFFALFFLTACVYKNDQNSKSKINETKNIIGYDNIIIADSAAKELYIKGLHSIEVKNYADAKIFFLQANEIEKNNPIILNGIAGTSANLGGDKSEIEELYQKAIQLDSIYISSYVNYGDFLNQNKRPFEAAKILLLGLHFNPTKTEKTALYYNLALAKVKSGDCLNAKDYATKSMFNASDPNQKKEISEFLERIEKFCDQLNSR